MSVRRETRFLGFSAENMEVVTYIGQQEVDTLQATVAQEADGLIMIWMITAKKVKVTIYGQIIRNSGLKNYILSKRQCSQWCCQLSTVVSCSARGHDHHSGLLVVVSQN